MSSKISFILSLIFVSLFFVMGIDLISIQAIYSDLDSKSGAISYRISEYGTIDDSLVSYIESKYKVTFECLDKCSPMFGDEVQYRISKEYKPLFVSKDVMKLSVTRFAVIGYYG